MKTAAQAAQEAKIGVGGAREGMEVRERRERDTRAAKGELARRVSGKQGQVGSQLYNGARGTSLGRAEVGSTEPPPPPTPYSPRGPGSLNSSAKSIYVRKQINHSPNLVGIFIDARSCRPTLDTRRRCHCRDARDTGGLNVRICDATGAGCAIATPEARYVHLFLRDSRLERQAPLQGTSLADWGFVSQPYRKKKRTKLVLFPCAI